MVLTFIRQRRYSDNPDAVFGSILLDTQPFAFFVQNADTLIPVGTYRLEPHDSPKHPNTLAFVNPELHVWHNPQDVPHEISDYRTECLLHPSNFGSELRGCTAPGESIARFNGRGYGVTSSRRTMNTLLEVLGGRSGHTAIIEESWEA